MLIKVVVSGSNPKDWKVPEWRGSAINQETISRESLRKSDPRSSSSSLEIASLLSTRSLLLTVGTCKHLLDRLACLPSSFPSPTWLSIVEEWLSLLTYTPEKLRGICHSLGAYYFSYSE